MCNLRLDSRQEILGELWRWRWEVEEAVENLGIEEFISGVPIN